MPSNDILKFNAPACEGSVSRRPLDPALVRMHRACYSRKFIRHLQCIGSAPPSAVLSNTHQATVRCGK